MDVAYHSSARTASHYLASCSNKSKVLSAASRTHRHTSAQYRRKNVVTQALFDPPPFTPDKLTIQYDQEYRSTDSSIPESRKYTLTHNDITGELNLTVGPDYNIEQISGFYTKLLRDEVKAEWRYQPEPSLHIYCHVSGEERWLAPPSLRNYIFRRELPLVLDTLLYADRHLLADHPQLSQADVFVHFQSHEEELNSIEFWGILGERSTWPPVPTSIMKRILMAFVGHPSPQVQQESGASQVPASVAIPAVVAALEVVQKEGDAEVDPSNQPAHGMEPSGSRHDDGEGSQASAGMHSEPATLNTARPGANEDVEVNIMAFTPAQIMSMSKPPMQSPPTAAIAAAATAQQPSGAAARAALKMLRPSLLPAEHLRK